MTSRRKITGSLHRLALVSFVALIAGSGISPLAAAQERERIAWMGVYLSPLSEEDASELGLHSSRGVLIVDVIPNTPAKTAGFLARDVVRKMDDKTIDDWDELREKMRASKPGQVMKIVVIRERKDVELTITLGERPARLPQEEVPH